MQRALASVDLDEIIAPASLAVTNEFALALPRLVEKGLSEQEIVEDFSRHLDRYLQESLPGLKSAGASDDMALGIIERVRSSIGRATQRRFALCLAKLILPDGSELFGAREEALCAAVSGLEFVEGVVAIEWSRLTYLQAHGSTAGGFELEYQEATLHEHFRSTDGALSTEVALHALDRYRQADPNWGEEVQWSRLALDPNTPSNPID